MSEVHLETAPEEGGAQWLAKRLLPLKINSPLRLHFFFFSIRDLKKSIVKASEEGCIQITVVYAEVPLCLVIEGAEASSLSMLSKSWYLR